MDGFPLWFMKRTATHEATWDECHAQVIAAPDETTARELASKNAYGEGADAWLAPADPVVPCVQIATASTYETAGVVLSKEAS